MNRFCLSAFYFISFHVCTSLIVDLFPVMSFDKNVFLNAFFKSVINEIFNRRVCFFAASGSVFQVIPIHK